MSPVRSLNHMNVIMQTYFLIILVNHQEILYRLEI